MHEEVTMVHSARSWRCRRSAARPRAGNQDHSTPQVLSGVHEEEKEEEEGTPSCCLKSPYGRLLVQFPYSSSPYTVDTYTCVSRVHSPVCE